MAALVVFAGLPGTGKTTMARAIATDRGGVYLRIDEIEQALRSLEPGRPIELEGYRVAEALARSNLGLHRDVVIDAVNPVETARDAWRRVAAETGARMAGIELVCSDPRAHRQRVETRARDISGLVLPDWAAVTSRAYRPWDACEIRLDTAGCTPEASLAVLRDRLGPLLDPR